jgi:transcriptional regulator with XRE-family HTH domain
MQDLAQFGRLLRELREGRGITQDDAVAKSGTYSEASGLRKIERGGQRPKRHLIITLLTKGLEERDPAKIDELLLLAGYQPLSESEWSRLGLAKPVIKVVVKPRHEPVRPELLRCWQLLSGLLLIAALVAAWRQDWFGIVAGTLYASLFPVSVCLETAYEFHCRESITAALLSGSAILAGAWGGLWMDSRRIAESNADGLVVAVLTVVSSAMIQWVLVRPALPNYAIVRATFQTHTAQAAHFKNTLYFLFAALAFWLLPRHCIEVLKHTKLMADGVLCPKPVWLWGLFAVVVGVSIPMGSRLLDALEPSPRHNVFVNLFYTRALLYFLFSAVCLAWYSSAYAGLASKFMISNSP